MNFTGIFNDAVFSKLTDSTITSLLGGTAVYYLQARDNEAKPYVVWNWQSVADENLTPSRMVNAILNARCFSGTASQAGSVDAAIDNVLHGHTLTVSGQTNFWTVRDMSFGDIVTEPNGIKTYVAGGLYRIRTGQ